MIEFLFMILFIAILAMCTKVETPPRKQRGGIWVNGKFLPPGTYQINGGAVTCGNGGSIIMKGHGNRGNNVSSG